MQTAFDAIIIGGGPAGSTAAILLARAGWRVACVEKQAFPRRKVCGECVSASNLPLLAALGLGADLPRVSAGPLRRVALLVGERSIEADLPPHTDARYRWGAVLAREQLDTLLLAQAVRCGARLFQPWIARSVQGGPGHFLCTIDRVGSRDQHTLAAPVLIDAHGSWERAGFAQAAQHEAMHETTHPTRHKTQHRGSDLLAFKANFTGTTLVHDRLPLLCFPGGYGGMVLGSDGVATVAFCLRRDRLQACARLSSRTEGQSPAEAAASYIAQHCAGLQAALAGARRQGGWLGAGPIHPGIRLTARNEQRANGAFLIGNAAGEAHPIIGEGISMAIQSACLLASTLAAQRSRMADGALQARLQQAYAAAWRHHFTGRIRLAAAFAHAAMRPALITPLLPLLVRHPQLLTRFAHWSGKTRAIDTKAGAINAALYQ